MALTFLLDTNVVSELTRPLPNGGVLQVLALHESACAISAPSLEELLYGCRRLPAGASQDWLLRWVDGLPDQLPVLPFDRAGALWLGVERARLGRLSRPVPRTDGEIAAVTLSHQLTLVTHNIRDFTMFDDLAVIDWHA